MPSLEHLASLAIEAMLKAYLLVAAVILMPVALLFYALAAVADGLPAGVRNAFRRIRFSKPRRARKLHAH